MSRDCSSSSCTGVHQAVGKGCVQCLERIIGQDNEAAANEECPDTGLTPLMRAVLDLEEPAEVIKSLVNLGADVNQEGFLQGDNKKIASATPLCLAVEQDRLEAIKALHKAAPRKSYS